jgi:hypothetical protein
MARRLGGSPPPGRFIDGNAAAEEKLRPDSDSGDTLGGDPPGWGVWQPMAKSRSSWDIELDTWQLAMSVLIDTMARCRSWIPSQ